MAYNKVMVEAPERNSVERHQYIISRLLYFPGSTYETEQSVKLNLLFRILYPQHTKCTAKYGTAIVFARTTATYLALATLLSAAQGGAGQSTERQDRRLLWAGLDVAYFPSQNYYSVPCSAGEAG